MVDAPSGIQVGPTSLHAVLTVGLAGWAAFSLPTVWLTPPPRPNPGTHLEPRGAPPSVPPLVLLSGFLAWAVLSGTAVGIGVDGVQMLLVLFLFVSSIALVSHGSSAGTPGRFYNWLTRAGVAASLTYGLVLLRGGLGAGGVVSRRSFALTAVLLIAALVPYRAHQGSAARLLPYLLLALIIASGSRMAMFVGAFLLLWSSLASRSGRRIARTAVLLLIVPTILWLLINRFDFIHDRFFGGDRAVEFNGVTLNAAGRSQIWQLVYSSAREHILLGQGPGTATELVRSNFDTVDQPHNEYLRILHDYGLVGLAIWLVAYFWLVKLCWSRARQASSSRAYQHWGAFLALVSLALMMITDNPLSYLWIMIPVGALVGVSMAIPEFSGRGTIPHERQHPKPRIREPSGNGTDT